eukprot:CAMPEP_0172896804 /NCGR_PEP_ID=MMETSP1075-20121228/156246_1 /TAXON_ID=2916 /ORGANISM="Ceratium fusus, Strain PA161109" /LENGTH=31 /DNA_ID= /DNA_START= /DNA_END= /DNA_ORIENTATION=
MTTAKRDSPTSVPNWDGEEKQRETTIMQRPA